MSVYGVSKIKKGMRIILFDNGRPVSDIIRCVFSL